MDKIRFLFKNKRVKFLTLFPIFGLIGLLIEMIFNAITYDYVIGKPYIALFGHSSLWMILVYGTGGIIIAVINEYERFYKLTMLVQFFSGGLIITIIEFLYGIVFNIIFKLNLWNYSQNFANLYGQIDLAHSLCWTLGMGFFIWLIDSIGWAIYRDWGLYNILDNYKDLFNDIRKLVRI